MARKPTGTVGYVPPRQGETIGHWRVRVTCADGSRPWIDLDPSPKSKQTEAKAREAAAHYSELVRERGIVAVPVRCMPQPARLQSASDSETLATYAERWLDVREARGKMSVRSDRARMKTHIVPVLGHLPIADVAREHIEQLVSALDAKVQAAELSWKSAVNVWTLVVRLFKDAVRSKNKALRVRSTNPCLDVEGPDRGVNKAKTYLYPSEFLAFVGCEDVPLVWRARVALAVYLFPRAAELEALEWGDVDVERGVVHIHRAIDRAHGGTKPTKAGVTRRFSVEPNIVPLLRLLHDAAGGQGRVISMPHEVNLARDFRHYLKKAGIERAELHVEHDQTRKPIGFHDLRATGITWCAVRGDNALQIQHCAGHTTFKTTQLYIREGQANAAGFGDVFPPLPTAFLKAQSSGIVPGNRPKTRKSAISKCRRWDSNPQAIADNGF